MNFKRFTRRDQAAMIAGFDAGLSVIMASKADGAGNTYHMLHAISSGRDDIRPLVEADDNLIVIVDLVDLKGFPL